MNSDTSPLSYSKILVVDDIDINLMVISTVLKIRFPQANLIECHSGKEAIEMIEANRFDLIFLDLHMPDLNGFEVAKHIREQEIIQQTTPIPIVAVSAEKESNIYQQLEINGFTAYLQKPISKLTMNTLITKITNSLLYEYKPN